MLIRRRSFFPGIMSDVDIRLFVPRSELAGLQGVSNLKDIEQRKQEGTASKPTPREGGFLTLIGAFVATKAIQTRMVDLLIRNENLSKQFIGIQRAVEIYFEPQSASQGVLEYALRRRQIVTESDAPSVITLEEKFPNTHAIALLDKFAEIYRDTSRREVVILQQMLTDNNELVRKVDVTKGIVNVLRTRQIAKAKVLLVAKIAATDNQSSDWRILSDMKKKLDDVEGIFDKAATSDAKQTANDAAQLVDATSNALMLAYVTPGGTSLAPEKKNEKAQAVVGSWKDAMTLLAIPSPPQVEFPGIASLKSRGASALYSGVESMELLLRYAQGRARDITTDTTEPQADVARMLGALVAATTGFRDITGTKPKTTSPQVKLLVRFATAVFNIEYVALWEYLHGEKYATVAEVYGDDAREFLRKEWLERSHWRGAIKESVESAYE